MKRFLIGLFTICFMCFANAEPTDAVKISATNVPTNATVQATSTNTYGLTVGSVTTPILVSGEILGVVVDFTGAASPNIDMDLQTRAGQMIPISRTILSIDDIAADAEYDVKNTATTTAGVAFTDGHSPIYLLSDIIDLIVYDSDKTNVNVSVTLILADK